MASLTVSATSANDVGGGAASWSNLANITASNGSYTNVNGLAFGGSSNILVARFSGLTSLPTNLISISGITAKYEGHKTGTDGATNELFQLWNGTSSSDGYGSDQAASAVVPASDSEITEGGVTDLWGAALTRSVVVGGNFGVGIQFTHSGGKSSCNVLIDYMEITVYYAPSTGYTDAQDYPQPTGLSSLQKGSGFAGAVDAGIVCGL